MSINEQVKKGNPPLNLSTQKAVSKTFVMPIITLRVVKYPHAFKFLFDYYCLVGTISYEPQ